MSDLTFDSFEVVKDYAIRGSARRPGRAMNPGVRFIVVHDTSNPGASARNHARFYRNDPNPSQPSSAHIFVDDQVILETIPALTGPPEQALHVLRGLAKDNQLFGLDANRAAIGIELCFGGTIDPDKAYRHYVWTVAKLCKVFGLDPSRRIVGHQVLDPARRSDPGEALRRSGRSYDGLLRDIVSTFQECEGGIGNTGSARIAVGKARTTVNLALRNGTSRLATKERTLAPKTDVTILKVVEGELVSGNDDWCEIEAGKFCWSGGLVNV